ncbi:hypothetical protein ACWT_7988 [Actinoplanes sp. SE50]|uniref:hypothetical protein n=1 Tax=unclassified Actinoplanes TaxID=2626549 RepID=UPI00023EE082|nr:MULTISPECIES: hypothetical protein [unclassified Actinoplanes]AEV88997.1 hypothetical protein ACPL_8119 [Actinoplanes sp. SE50/110]ATO87403.1 hypothetical protein ACWT_7988 [Actinoplanes sp. SE50]SLM04821.1 hypothetical protein ACSP50_8130 [Actinoplanes sp. SE50/110]
MTPFALLFLLALAGSTCFALGRAFGRGERYERGYREGFRDGETGSLARATRLMQLGERQTIAPVVETMLGPYCVPQQMAPRPVGPAVAGVPVRPQFAV